jgi:hypothetical protein
MPVTALPKPACGSDAKEAGPAWSDAKPLRTVEGADRDIADLFGIPAAAMACGSCIPEGEAPIDVTDMLACEAGGGAGAASTWEVADCQDIAAG